MKATELYIDYADFSQYVDGMAADTTYEQLAPSIRVATRVVRSVITDGVYSSIARKEIPEKDDKTKADDMEEAYEALRTAIASLSMYRYQIFFTVKKNDSGASLYKYQHEEIKKHYLEAFSAAMDNLLEWLDNHGEVGKYKESEQFKLRQELPIRSEREFEKYFQIGNSAYFFSQIIYIIRDSWAKIKPVIRDCQDGEMFDLAKKSCCYDVMAKVVMTFDEDKLPESIRLDANHEFSKDGGMAERKVLAAQFGTVAKEAMSTLQANLRGSSNSSVLDDRNSEENKFFML